MLSLKDYGAKGDGVTDDTLAIGQWLAACQGDKGYVPPGVYMTSGVDFKPTKTLNIECDGTFKHTGTKPSGSYLPILHIDGVNVRPSLIWRGGSFDASKIPYTPPYGEGNCLAPIRINRCHISGVKFYGGEKALSDDGTTIVAGGDSGIFIVDTHWTTIEGCYFQGMPDLGIYVSGNFSLGPSDDGGDCVIANNHFNRCQFGAAAKRQSRRTIITGNTFVGCRIGAALYDAGVGTNPAKDGIVTNNCFYKSGWRAIEIHGGVGNIVANNQIKDYGYEWSGAAPASGGTSTGIRLFGTKNAAITGNTIGMEELPASASHVAIHLKNWTDTNGAAWKCAPNNLSTNICYGGNIVENSGAYPNRYSGNSATVSLASGSTSKVT